MAPEVWDANPLSWSAINAGTTRILNTDIIPDGYIEYVEGIVNTSQKNLNYKVGDGTSQYQNLPYKLPVYIEISADIDLSSYDFAVDGNELIIHNTDASSHTITYDGSTSDTIPAGGVKKRTYVGAWLSSGFPESGTFTPIITFGGASTGITYAAVTGGLYTLIGDRCTINGRIVLTSKGTDTGAAEIGNLPFTANSDSANSSVANLRFNSISFADVFQGFVLAGENSIILREVTTSGVETNLTDANFTNTSDIMFELTYKI